ncbi:diacylglycerol/lipid kinase family protein [Natronoflexus pectinivorans]|uniref:YegS/Rv2252/BmrU family lipid kinase n=1 Tax=Natronoflexus pectinivorans TaxID=682526 RepID=A0A4R2GLS1_9BACT|nr:diacylglycerol kinase family protein [Natronoflexus pectinivorans]TCO09893.1 YegS/Rv2252/BmrU family lipid kinase [Natronoflexus pectinivorans]
MKKKILFIINPVSGIGRQKSMEGIIHQEMNMDEWLVEIAYTEYKNHAFEISSEAADSYDVVVAVGGDGTVNEVGRGLINSESALGIIPTGSGNGLARHLEIPFKINRALKALNQCNFRKIDVIKANDYFSLNVAGIGFDAFISHKFAKKKNRGPLAYMQLITKEFANYKSAKYKVTIDGQTQLWDAFLISFANSTQYGNNFHIAPQARIDDGLIDVCLIRDFPKVTAPALLISMLDRSIDKNRYDIIVKAVKITIEHDSNLLGHVDGEPVVLGNKAEVKILPLALKVAIPPKHLKQTQNILSPLLEMLPAIK